MPGFGGPPRFFQKIAGALTIALTAVIAVEMITVFLFRTHHGIFDWIVLPIFCGSIGYGWGRANQIPETLDKALGSAAALSMDIIFLFLRVLADDMGFGDLGCYGSGEGRDSWQEGTCWQGTTASFTPATTG